MNADDPRHGTQAGRSQHHRDGEDPCPDCIEGDILAARRRRKRSAMGHVYARPIGDALHRRLVELREQGATYEQIASWAGVDFGQAYHPIVNGPTHRVYARTWLALNSIKPTGMVTTIGCTRRIQALYCLGYSLRVIASRAGMTANGLTPIRDGASVGPLNHQTRETLAALYSELHMTAAPTGTVGERKSATRARGDAKRNNWAPPLAWDNIDDPNEQPQGVRTTDTRHHLTDLDPVIVERILSGDWRLSSTPTEKTAVCEAWAAAGGTLGQLEKLTGWRARRYYQVGAA